MKIACSRCKHTTPIHDVRSLVELTLGWLECPLCKNRKGLTVSGAYIRGPRCVK